MRITLTFIYCDFMIKSKIVNEQFLPDIFSKLTPKFTNDLSEIEESKRMFSSEEIKTMKIYGLSKTGIFALQL